jgi:hypothetical protein
VPGLVSGRAEKNDACCSKLWMRWKRVGTADESARIGSIAASDNPPVYVGRSPGQVGLTTRR